MQTSHELLAPSEVAHAVLELAPWLARRAKAPAREQRVPDDVLVALARAGCLAIAVPAEHGGRDLAMPEALTVVEALARVDASLAWLVAQVALAHAVFAHLGAPARERLYADGADVVAAGAAAPKGRATPLDGGWRVSGRWPLVTGCAHASWLYVQCLVLEGEQPRVEAGGLPQMRIMVLPAADVRVLETWRGLGLRDSGSHDVLVRGADCPAELSCDVIEDTAAGALARVPSPTQAGLLAGAVVTGIAYGALDAVAELAARKRPAFRAQRLAESPLFHDALGEAHASLAAARALLLGLARDADARVRDGQALAAPEQARLRAAGPKACELATHATELAYELAGSSAVYDGSPLQGRLRDARCLTQHFSLGRDFYGRLGALLVGADPGVPV